MVEQDLGQATIVYDDPGEGTIEERVENEHVAYFQDHWIVRTGEDESGNDTVRRIPAQRVYYVERSVEEFEQEVETLRTRVESLADQVRSKVLGGGEDGNEEKVYHIEVEGGDGDDGGPSAS
jgi:hypothetical protein